MTELYNPGQNTGVGSLSFLQGIFPTQGSNPGPPHCRQILYQLSHQGSPTINILIYKNLAQIKDIPSSSTVKNPPANVGDAGSIPGLYTMFISEC